MVSMAEVKELLSVSRRTLGVVDEGRQGAGEEETGELCGWWNAFPNSVSCVVMLKDQGDEEEEEKEESWDLIVLNMTSMQSSDKDLQASMFLSKRRIRSGRLSLSSPSSSLLCARSKSLAALVADSKKSLKAAGRSSQVLEDIVGLIKLVGCDSVTLQWPQQ